jgi:hypothetical protein
MNERHRLWLQSGKVQSVLLDQLLASTPHCQFGVGLLTATKISPTARRWSDE